jgi:hypothetical protein
MRAKLTVRSDGLRAQSGEFPQIAAFFQPDSGVGSTLRRRNQALGGLVEATRRGVIGVERAELAVRGADHDARLA